MNLPELFIRLSGVVCICITSLVSVVMHSNIDAPQGGGLVQPSPFFASTAPSSTICIKLSAFARSVQKYHLMWSSRRTLIPSNSWRSLSKSARGRRGLQAPPLQEFWRAGSPPGTAGYLEGGSPPVKTLWQLFSVPDFPCWAVP